MRGLKVIGLFCVLVFLAACTSCHNDPVETRLIASPTAIASSELISIDSLMWQQPDSALMRLLPCFDTCCRDGVHTVSTAYNCHYAHLLLAELLYKNDCAQTNRAELQQAVSYFDSLVRQAFPPFKGVPEGRGIHTNNSNDILSFLDARTHYINGVGYYENDSAVEACAEYLKALEIMDERFEEKELVGKKAKFMAYTNNRLGDLFSEQFMMEPAIACYKNSYEYSLVSPVSSYSVSNALYHMGLQFNMKGEKDSANYYYSQALANMPDSTNPYYRDIVSTQYLLLYQLTHQTEASLKRLKQMVALTEDDDERLTRYLAIGDIYFEEGFYDSACFYLEPVLKNNDNSFLQIQVANYLRIIYDSLGNKEKSDWCKLYLALHNETGAENSALVSQLSDLFKTYMSQRQEKEAEAKREAAVKKVLKVIIPIAVVLALAIIVTAKWRSKKLLKAKEERHQQEMETERQAHKMQQAALSGRLKRSNEELRELKDQIRQRNDAVAKTEAAASFTEEPVCRLILERVKEGRFKSKVDCTAYKDFALNKQQLLDLRLAADRHYDQFTVRLKKAYPELTQGDLDYCCLYLLGLTDADIAALMQRAYNTVIERNGKMRKIFGSENPLPITLKSITNGFSLA
jgi:tetratricopeptide (TPR) repeat protein